VADRKTQAYTAETARKYAKAASPFVCVPLVAGASSCHLLLGAAAVVVPLDVAKFAISFLGVVGKLRVVVVFPSPAPSILQEASTAE
tara:strand:- start:10 stop:270 length:261 start_codon:yes stop_codon:yes gene_type:complete